MCNQPQADCDESEDSEANSHSQHRLLIVSLNGELCHLVALERKQIRTLNYSVQLTIYYSQGAPHLPRHRLAYVGADQTIGRSSLHTEGDTSKHLNAARSLLILWRNLWRCARLGSSFRNQEPGKTPFTGLRFSRPLGLMQPVALCLVVHQLLVEDRRSICLMSVESSRHVLKTGRYGALLSLAKLPKVSANGPSACRNEPQSLELQLRDYSNATLEALGLHTHSLLFLMLCSRNS